MKFLPVFCWQDLEQEKYVVYVIHFGFVKDSMTKKRMFPIYVYMYKDVSAFANIRYVNLRV